MTELGLDVEHGGQDLALAGLRVGQCPQDRHPGGGADQVEPAVPDQGSARRSSRSAPHSTGVGSAIQTSSSQQSLSASRSRITCLISGRAARSRLLRPGWQGR